MEKSVLPSVSFFSVFLGFFIAVVLFCCSFFDILSKLCIFY